MAASILPPKNTHGLGKVGIGIFVPALTLLVKPDFVTALLNALHVNMSTDMRATVLGLVTAYAGYLLLEAKSPASIHPDEPTVQ